MQQKLKSVFRRSSKSRSSSGQQSEQNVHPAKASPPRGDRHRVSSNRHGRTSVDSPTTGSVYTGGSRPVSSIYDELQKQAPTKRAATDDFASSTDPNGGAIANDYKAYLPALSPVNGEHGDEYTSIDKDKQHINGRKEARHEEDVADRNIARYSGSFDGGHCRAPGLDSSAGQSPGTGLAGSALGPVQTNGSVGKYSIGQDIVRIGGLHDGVRSHMDTPVHEGSPPKRSSVSTKTVLVDAGTERTPLVSGSDNEELGLPQELHDAHDTQFGTLHTTTDGTADGEKAALASKLHEDGVADLRNTIDTDGDISWAPAVTHEVIKPHQHEIVQHKIYREIHNYEYFHRIQPVMMTEVLPPRHWIPNPDGEGLIEISADELPARTGDNRWWSICEHSSASPLAMPKYRTEPEIIEAGTFITEEGFERKETIIIHPPTLADLTGYGGPVQAMHFDHKTGKSWMGELTTMDKLEQLQQELDRAPDAQAFKMEGLAESLPNVPFGSSYRDSKSIPRRKPVNGQFSVEHSSNTGRKMAAASAKD